MTNIVKNFSCVERLIMPANALLMNSLWQLFMKKVLGFTRFCDLVNIFRINHLKTLIDHDSHIKSSLSWKKPAGLNQDYFFMIKVHKIILWKDIGGLQADILHLC